MDGCMWGEGRGTPGRKGEERGQFLSSGGERWDREGMEGGESWLRIDEDGWGVIGRGGKKG